MDLHCPPPPSPPPNDDDHGLHVVSIAPATISHTPTEGERASERVSASPSDDDDVRNDIVVWCCFIVLPDSVVGLIMMIIVVHYLFNVFPTPPLPSPPPPPPLRERATYKIMLIWMIPSPRATPIKGFPPPLQSVRIKIMFHSGRFRPNTWWTRSPLAIGADQGCYKQGEKASKYNPNQITSKANKTCPWNTFFFVDVWSSLRARSSSNDHWD